MLWIIEQRQITSCLLGSPTILQLKIYHCQTPSTGRLRSTKCASPSFYTHNKTMYHYWQHCRASSRTTASPFPWGLRAQWGTMRLGARDSPWALPIQFWRRQKRIQSASIWTVYQIFCGNNFVAAPPEWSQSAEAYNGAVTSCGIMYG